MNKKTEKTAQTRVKLMDAFWELYKYNNIAKITVKEITDKAGFYRSTFYLHFTDVYDQLEKLEDDIIDDWKKTVANAENMNHEELMDAICVFYEVKGEYVSVLLGAGGDPSFLPKIKNEIKPLLHDMQRHSPDNLKFEFIFEFLISGMLGMLTHWYENKRHIPVKYVVSIEQSFVENNIALRA